MPDLGICYFIGGWGWLEFGLFVGDKDNEKWFVQGEKGFFSTKCLQNGENVVFLQRSTDHQGT